MEIDVAINLIRPGVPGHSSQTWADVGAGSGLFTKALSLLLPSQSTVIAVDKNATALKEIELPTQEVGLITNVLDFVHQPLTLPLMDDVLLANALHFSPDKTALLKTIRSRLKDSGRVILVEYDTDTPNAWVPYPVSLKSLYGVATDAGFKQAEKIGAAPSVYGRAMIYAALLS